MDVFSLKHVLCEQVPARVQVVQLILLIMQYELINFKQSLLHISWGYRSLVPVIVISCILYYVT